MPPRGKRPPKPAAGEPWANKGLLLLVIVLYYAGLLSYVTHRLNWTPIPQPADSPGSVFGEDRAMQHVVALTRGIGDHQVSTPGLDEATAYMLEQVQALKDLAAARQDVEVEVHLDTVSGEAEMTFLHFNFTNVYRGLDNVALVVRPKPTLSAADPTLSTPPKALLVASHYDSAVCSHGAADDGAQVGVMLEAARALLHQEVLPKAPVVFLWTGGEEPISPAAHGWMQHSPLVPQLGAFINLEAMGGGGLPIVFQHTGAWALEAWAAGAPHARGTRVAQDVFDANLIPADSDYRMFSARHYGTLPGIDVAFLMDSAAYHSYLDQPERIRRGVLQEMGEDLMGAIYSFTSRLADEGAALQSAAELQDRAVYFDVLALHMFSWRDSQAHLLHALPAALSIGLPLFTPLPTLPGAKQPPGLWTTYQLLAAATLRSLLSVVLAVVLPAAMGIARVLLSGVPMVWYSQQWVGHAMFMPIGAFGALLPYLSPEQGAERSAVGSVGRFIGIQLQGCAAAAGLIAVALTAAGLLGNAVVFLLSSLLAAAMSLLLGTPKLSIPLLLLALALATVPLSVGSTIVAVFVRVMMERMGISGHVSTLLADGVVGALSGAAVLACACGAMLPLLGYALSGVRRPLLALLLLSSLGMAAYSTLHIHPYSETMPKRVAISHVHITKPLPHTFPHGQPAAAPLGEDGESVTSGSVGGVDGELLRDAAEAAMALGSRSSGLPPPPSGSDGDGEAGVGGQVEDGSVGGSVDHDAAALLAPTPTANPTADTTTSAFPRCLHRNPAPSSSSSSSPSASSSAFASTLSASAAYWESSRPVEMQVVGSRMSFGTTDSMPIAFALDTAALKVLPPMGREFTAVYPLTEMVEGIVTEGPPPPPLPAAAAAAPVPDDSDRSGSTAGQRQSSAAGLNGAPGPVVIKAPYLCLTRAPTAGGVGSEGADGVGGRRAHFAIHTERAGWGIVNVTGPLKAWSFGKRLTPSSIRQGKGVQHITRFMLQPQTPHTLDFWLEVEVDAKAQAGGQCSAGGASDASAGADKGTCRSADDDGASADSGSNADGSAGSDSGSGGDAADSDIAVGDLPMGLHIELTVTFLDRTPELLAAKARLPPWTAEIFLATAYFSQWDY